MTQTVLSMKRAVALWAALLAACLCGAPLRAQDSLETTLKADFVNQYVWRGMRLGGAGVQPELGVAWKGLSLSAWGHTGFVGAENPLEIDLTLEYGIGGFSIGLTDYWADNTGVNPNYFCYRPAYTGHTFEAHVGYDFGFLSLNWYTNVWGYDGDALLDGGKRPFSSFAELTVPFTLAGCDWEACVGAVPFRSDFYGNEGFSVTHVALTASREIPITDSFSLPVFASGIANLPARQAWFVVGITLQAF